MRFSIINVGTLDITRHGKVTVGTIEHYRWRFVATDVDGNTFRSSGTTPTYADADDVFALACEAISVEVAEFTGDDTGNIWGLYASDTERGFESAADHAISPMFYRMESADYAPDGVTFDTKKEIEQSLRNHFRTGWISEGHVQFVYVNNRLEPLGCYVVGPRGGLTWENY